MTRKEALKLLRGGPKGIAKWNRRRKEGTIPDLQNADLCDANLTAADLHDANLSDANLNSAHLYGSNLNVADLSNASLTSTSLISANLYGANLRMAQLKGATLYGADLRKAQLSGTDFAGAQAWGTVFANDLSEAIGLDDVVHDGPSNLGVASVLSFKDNLPEKFLRGCGLRDEEIAYFRSQIGKPDRFYDCFISYSTKDDEFATRLYNDFQKAGIRCWKWNEDAKTGQNLWSEIDHAIRKFDKLVLIASESSLKSPYVADEIERAIAKEHKLIIAADKGEWIGDTSVIFPVKLDDYILNEWVDKRKVDVTKKVIANAKDWKTDHKAYQKVLNKLVEDLKK